MNRGKYIKSVVYPTNNKFKMSPILTPSSSNSFNGYQHFGPQNHGTDHEKRGVVLVKLRLVILLDE